MVFKSLVLGLLLLSLGSARSAHADDQFSFSETDKQAHMAVSYGASLTSTLIFEKHGTSRCESVLYSSAIVLSLGLLKELLVDDHFSGGDLVANMFGTGVSAGMVFAFEF